MRVHLSIGEARVRVRFMDSAELQVACQASGVGRSTIITVTINGNDGSVSEAEGIAHCSPKDNFCRATGRKLALQRYLEANTFITRADRALLWKAVCPEFYRGRRYVEQTGD